MISIGVHLLVILQLLPTLAIGVVQRYGSAAERLETVSERAAKAERVDSAAEKLEAGSGKAARAARVDSAAEKLEAGSAKAARAERFGSAAEKLEAGSEKAARAERIASAAERLEAGSEKAARTERFASARFASATERLEASSGRAARTATTARTTRFSTLEGGQDNKAALGKMNKMGVTRYQRHAHKKTKTSRKDGKFFWADSANREGGTYSGATDLLENLSWGWHHPTGVYNTIPVGSPLFDDEQNIYIGSDDAIRKFDVTGTLLWSYAPRGQLAAAPTLVLASSRRLQAPVTSAEEAEAEDMLRPDWAKANGSVRSAAFNQFKAGDLVKVKPGFSYRADGRDLYKAGDLGTITGVEDGEKERRAVITWARTGTKSVVKFHAMGDRFLRVQQEMETKTVAWPAMLVGSTTSGFVFSIDLASGEELWVTWASNDIAGVKGAVAGKDGIIVVATDKCTDRYCYRYRNQTNPLTPGNSMVRGLSAVDGSAVWQYRTFAPVWNMVPLWGPDGTVMFQDWEGRLYSLDLLTGALVFKVGGDLGTHTQAAATYDPGHNVAFALGMQHYNVETYRMTDAIGTDGGKFCNPYVAPGILINCWTWPGGRGFIRGYNASSGRAIWHRDTPEPPAGATAGALNSPEHTRLVLTMGFNCRFNSPSQISLAAGNLGSRPTQRRHPVD
ncbi:unnamed protein product [Prorocentrum cordatum]|uniref:Pyrrolo-quinoline quinone repeat domain-containing protein n=1 Tax=Prorocentrum cordatum TaxID=2364126 RepID=A0ABN9U4I0_9DINO|nr:unnamed protein product [Polarella glacialis]